MARSTKQGLARRGRAGVAATAVAALASFALPTAQAQAADPTCAVPDARATVRILDYDSGVANRAAGGGCTINDLIEDEGAWTDKGHFMQHVFDVVDDLRADGVISSSERSDIISASARSDAGAAGGYETIFDGTAESFADWAYAGNGGFDLLPDGTLRSRVGAAGGFGTLWYTPEQFEDFSMRLQFRDEAPDTRRANSGVQVRFPALDAPVPGCPTTFNGNEQNNLSWIAVNCGHEIQINDSPEGGNNDPRKTGSIYGFADLDRTQAMATDKGIWNDLEIRVVGQDYTVIRNGVVINEFENLPGLPFPGRPNDPDSSSRGLVGYVGLQAHGSAPDIVSFRNIRVRDLSEETQGGVWFDSISDQLSQYLADDRINSRVAASLADRLQRAAALADTGSESRTLGYLEQFIARANNQIKGDAQDAEVRAALVSQAQALADLLQQMEDAENAE